MKVALTGTAGIGKTTLARALGQALALPVLEEDHQGLIHAALQLKLARSRNSGTDAALNACREAFVGWVKKRDSLQAQHPAFVADRFAVDVLSAWLNFDLSLGRDSDTVALLNACRKQAAGLDAVIVPPVRCLTTEHENESGLKRQISLNNRLLSHSLTIGLTTQICRAKIILIPEAIESVGDRVKYALDRLPEKDVA